VRPGARRRKPAGTGRRPLGEARGSWRCLPRRTCAPVDFDDIHFDRRAYDPQIAYAQAKTANSLFAVEATRRWRDDGIVANAVNPGGVATGLQRNFSTAQRESLAAAEAAGVFTYKTVGQGAATTLVAAVAPERGRAATSMTAVRPTPFPTKPPSPSTPTE